MQAVQKCFVFVGGAEAATEVEHRIVIFQRQFTQKFLQLLEPVTNLRRIAFMGLGIGWYS